MMATSRSDTNTIIRTECADNLIIKANGQQFSMFAANNGKNEIKTGDDKLKISSDVLAESNGKNIINGGKGDDLIKLSKSGLSFNDVFIDGGDGQGGGTDDMDVLLIHVYNLNGFKNSINSTAIQILK